MSDFVGFCRILSEKQLFTSGQENGRVKAYIHNEKRGIYVTISHRCITTLNNLNPHLIYRIE